jgi:hypothetical protein
MYYFNVLSLIIKFYLLVITEKMPTFPCQGALFQRYIFMPAFGQGKCVRVNGHYIREIYYEYM